MVNDNSISPVHQAVFGLLRHSLMHTRLTLPGETDWDALWKELQQQSVHLLVAETLMQCNPENQVRYLQALYHGSIGYHKRMRQQEEICTLLKDAGIGCVVLKGAAACQYYPIPANRCMGDIDLLVSPPDYPRAKELLLAGGTFLKENFRHCSLNRDGTVIELHHCFSTFKNEKQRQAMDRLLLDALSRTVTLTQEGCAFPALPTPENGLVLLAHICQHLELGLGLRQFVDWVLFVNRHLDDAFWHGEFCPLLRQVGLETLAITVTRMCQMYLGARQDITWCGSAPEALCRELMCRTLEQGNFGVKMPRRLNTTVGVLRLRKNLPAFFRRLQDHGCKNWAALRRFPILKPFAWLYQLCRYIRLGLRKKHPLRFLRNALRREKQDNSLLERSGVFHDTQED